MKQRLVGLREGAIPIGCDKVLAPLSTWGRLSLGSQLAILVLVTAAPLLLASALMFRSLFDHERDGVRQALMRNTQTLAALVENEIDTHAAILVTLSQSPSLLAGDLVAFSIEAKRAAAFVPGAWVTVTDLQGQTVLNTLVAPGSDLLKHPAPDIVREAFATGKQRVSDLLFDPIAQTFVAFVEMPVYRAGVPLYSLGISVDPGRFFNLISPRFVHGELVGILDRQHRFVARVPDHVNRLGALASEGWRAAIARQPEGWSDNASLEGSETINAYTSTIHGWTVGVSQLRDKIESPFRSILRSAGLALVGLIGLSLGLSVLLARHITRGMTLLAEMTRQIGAGTPLQSPPVPFIEARIITKALEDTSVELTRRQRLIEEANIGLEEKVAQRTADLAAEIERRKQSDARVHQMEKLEAVGQLTGGIAHDFNNMLAVVISSLRLLKRRLDRGDKDYDQFIESAKQGAERAALLTQRLLAFSRRQPLTPAPCDANKLIANISELLRRTLPESISIETVLAGGLWQSNVDASQLENTLVNLATNARDAMPEGGKLTIETANTHLDEAYARANSEVSEGQYVMIAVTDTGTGMAPDVAARAFEPFFTTKSTGKGTGLGLAQVYGFIKQSGGHVKIYNEPGHGVTFKIYLPRHFGEREVVSPVQPAEETMPMSDGRHLVLVVEDDPTVLELTTGMLTELGYRTVAASTPKRALEIIKTEPAIDVMLTDIVMPEMNGRILADEIRKIRPNLPVLFATGYTRNAVVHNGVVDPDVSLIMKPYTLEALAHKMASVIRRPS